MNATERWMIAGFIGILLAICLLCITALMMHEPPEPYDPPCRTVGHLEIPEEKCE